MTSPDGPPASDEAPTRTLTGWRGALARVLAVGLSLYALYWVVAIVQPQVYRVSFLLVVLVLIFLLFPARRGRARVSASRESPHTQDDVRLKAGTTGMSPTDQDFRLKAEATNLLSEAAPPHGSRGFRLQRL